MNTLLEIGTEHLPARFVMPSLEQLKTHTEAILQEKRISFESVETFGTYRRLVVMINGIADKAADIQKEVKGPPAKLLKDANGKLKNSHYLHRQYKHMVKRNKRCYSPCSNLHFNSASSSKTELLM